MRSLFRKELRTLLPWLGLVVLIWGGDLVFEALSNWPDDEPLRDALDLLEIDADDRLAHIVLFFFLALSAAVTLLPGEFDRGQIEFLDSLPPGRSQVFWAKVLAAGAVFGLAPLLAVVESFFFHALSRDSLDPSFHVRLVATAAGLHLALFLVLLSVSFLLAYLRRFAPAVAVLLYLVLDLIRKRVPSARVLDVGALIQPALDGQTWIVPWRLILLQGAFALACLLAAWGIFVHTSTRSASAEPSRRRGWLTMTAAVISALILAGTLAFRARWAGNETDERSEVTVARSHTRHYVFSFPASLGNRAAAVAGEADAVYLDVARALGADPIGRLMVDGTGIRRSAHASGQATGGALRLDLPRLGTRRALAVLAHETAHAFAVSLSQDRLEGQAAVEGLATWIGEEVRPIPAEAAGRRLRAATLHARKEAVFDEILDDEIVAQRYDPDVVYPLGEVLFEAAASTCGDPVVGEFLRALGRSDRPEDLSGREALVDALAHAGCDLERVAGVYQGILESHYQEHRQRIDAFPRLWGSMTRQPSRVGMTVHVTGALAEKGDVACRFRSDASSPEAEFRYGSRDEAGTCWEERAAFGDVIHYQLGYWEPDFDAWLWHPWVEVPLSD